MNKPTLKSIAITLSVVLLCAAIWWIAYTEPQIATNIGFALCFVAVIYLLHDIVSGIINKE